MNEEDVKLKVQDVKKAIDSDTPSWAVCEFTELAEMLQDEEELNDNIIEALSGLHYKTEDWVRRVAGLQDITETDR